MNRSAPLRRSTRLKPRRETPRKSGRVRDEAYMARVRGLPCLVVEMMPRDDWGYESCYGPMHAHHMREGSGAGMGKKPSDDLCVPLCQAHHAHWHAHSGVFKGLSRNWRNDFAEVAVQATRSALGVTK